MKFILEKGKDFDQVSEIEESRKEMDELGKLMGKEYQSFEQVKTEIEQISKPYGLLYVPKKLNLNLSPRAFTTDLMPKKLRMWPVYYSAFAGMGNSLVAKIRVNRNP